jgi:hypothetical protein
MVEYIKTIASAETTAQRVDSLWTQTYNYALELARNSHAKPEDIIRQQHRLEINMLIAKIEHLALGKYLEEIVEESNLNLSDRNALNDERFRLRNRIKDFSISPAAKKKAKKTETGLSTTTTAKPKGMSVAARKKQEKAILDGKQMMMSRKEIEETLEEEGTLDEVAKTFIASVFSKKVK